MGRKLHILIAVLAVSIGMLSATSGADAAVTWPAKCTTWKCVNAHLNAMHAADLNQNTKLSNVAWVNCLDALFPMTGYPGYVVDDGAGGFTEGTAFDLTKTGDPIFAWIPGIYPGTCQAPGVAAKMSRGADGLTFRAPTG